MKVYLIHGWQSSGERGFRVWLKKELEKLNYDVFAFDLPNPEFPKEEEWLDVLSREIKTKEGVNDIVILGHSLGGLTTLKFLESLPEGHIIKKAVLVAPVVNYVTNINEYHVQTTFIPWTEKGLNYKKINESVESIVAFFSDNDKYIPIESADILKKNLNINVIIEHDKDHYATREKTEEVPLILNVIIN